MITKRIVLHFPQEIADQPIVYRLAKDYKLEFNILKATINSEEGGLLVLELSGDKSNYKKGLEYLNEVGLEVQPLSRDIRRNEEKCSHCSVCVPVCPSRAFSIDPAKREVRFEEEKCVACGLCIKICPLKAMAIKF